MVVSLNEDLDKVITVNIEPILQVSNCRYDAAFVNAKLLTNDESCLPT